MAILTSYEELKKYRDEYRIVPVAKEILSDMVTPIEVMRRLRKKSSRTFILESVVNQSYTGRYTFLGYDPKLSIILNQYEMKVEELHTGEVKVYRIRRGGEEADAFGSPAEVLRELLKDYRSPKLEGLPSFTGGLVGYFAYDYIKYSEPKLDLTVKESDGFPDMELMLYDKCIAFDNIRQRIVLITNVPTGSLEEGYARALAELDEMEQTILFGEKEIIPKGRLLSELKPLFDKERYCRMVEQGKHYIFEGDIFQVVLSNRMEADYAGSLFDAYRLLRGTNPSPYMFYFDMNGEELAGASPETLVKLDNGELYTYPLAGTRPRGKSPEEDKALEEGLLKDEKELAEHNMLVDLGRNDLGRISRFGTVEVVDYMSVHKYSHVMHIGSTVKGLIDKERYDALDAVSAVLPAGTLSGAPKIRACEIISELEGVKRGVYGGAVGYIDFAGNLDTCIAIRLAYKKAGKVFVRAGAGIVADSVPESEYQESLNKARAVLNSVEQASES